MKRLILLVTLGLLTVSYAFAAPSKSLIKLILPTGKSMEGGIAVNPVTHKAYVIAELNAEGADDAKAVFVYDEGSITTNKTPKKLMLPSATIQPVKIIPIPNENEYLAIDSARNLIYVGTKYSVEQDEADTGDDAGGGEVEPPGGEEPPVLAPVTSTTPVPVILGTLTVIDGNTDTIIATWYFAPGIEPEGTAVDPDTGIIYLAVKAPEGEAANDDSCSSGIPIFDVGEPEDVECWTAGTIHAFYVDPAAPAAGRIQWLGEIPAGDDPESIAFVDGRIYAANEDDGTVTIARRVNRDHSGGGLITDVPQPPSQPYSAGVAPYSLGVFYGEGPNELACAENKFEADKMVGGGGSVFVTDDRSRVAKISGSAVAIVRTIPGATECQAVPNSDGGGLNTANNVAFMPAREGKVSKDDRLYVASEQDTLAVFDPNTMELQSTITIPGAKHLDGIAVDVSFHRVWLTDEETQQIYVLQGACANGTGMCIQ